MQEELHEITKRIQLLMSHYSLRDDGRVVVADFANKIKIGHQVLNRCFNIDKRSGKYPKPSEKIISAIKKSLPEVNADWLLTGEGEMLKSDSPPHGVVREPPPPYGDMVTYVVKEMIEQTKRSEARMDELVRMNRIMIEENREEMRDNRSQMKEMINEIKTLCREVRGSEVAPRKNPVRGGAR